MKGIFEKIKDLFAAFARNYKDISRVSGGCAYIPPKCLSSNSPGSSGEEAASASESLPESRKDSEVLH